MSLFPPPDKRAEVQFRFAKFISYRARMALVGLFLAAGFAVQLLAGFWWGLPLLVAGAALGMVKGYRPKEAFVSEEKWSRVTPDEFIRIREKAARQKAWDRDPLDITNPVGGLLFAGLGVVCVIVGVALGFGIHWRLGVYWLADCAILVLPHWFTGTRGYLKKDRLIVKIEALQQVMAALREPSDLQVLPMLATRQTVDGKDSPVDARLMVHVLNAPAWFLGMQVQVSLNNVQGTDYPYVYAVLIARPEGGLPTRWEGVKDAVAAAAAAGAAAPAAPGLLGKFLQWVNRPAAPAFESSCKEGVDVLVIRQTTTKNSGYHTPPPLAIRIVNVAADAARKILAGTDFK